MDLKGAEIRNIIDLCMDIGAKNAVPLKVSIPYYQRPYRWEKRHIENLISDFYKNKIENQQAEYFVGSVVLVKNARGTDRHDIIDGQQRITTVFLMNYLKFILLRSYIEELIIIRRTSLDGQLRDLEDCYGKLFGASLCDELSAIHKEIINALDTIYDMEEDEREKIYTDILKKYQNVVGLPERNISNVEEYQEKYVAGLESVLSKDCIALNYCRKSYNMKLEKALSQVLVWVSKDKNPKLMDVQFEKGSIEEQYWNAIKYEFEALCEIVIDSQKNPLTNTKNLIDAISEMIENIKFCVIMTGNEKDAYTLFEVLNDRALEIDDLDLIKNLFYKEYCNKSGEAEDIIDRNIEKLDDIWGDDIFTRDLPGSHVKLISYLGTIYFTADEDVFINKTERYREILEKKYFDEIYHKKQKQYKYVNVVNDLRVYHMIKVIIEEYNLPVNNAANALIKAECNTQKSITYKTFHLLNALGYDAVMPALTNLIIRKYIDEYADGGKREIDISNFKDYIRDLGNDWQHTNEEYIEIHNWAFEIWRSALLAKDYTIPRELAKKIISAVSYGNNALECVSITAQSAKDMEKEFYQWTNDWRYKKIKNSDIKVKVLFINLFGTDKTDTALQIKPSMHTFTTDKLQLDHMEANNPDSAFLEKYFKPQDVNDKRENYVDCLGNFMILDSDDNNNKDNKPLSEAIVYYENMCQNHWMVNEIKELLYNDQFNQKILIGEINYEIPNEAFFMERRKNLQKYFYALLNRKLDEKTMYF